MELTLNHFHVEGKMVKIKVNTQGAVALVMFVRQDPVCVSAFHEVSALSQNDNRFKLYVVKLDLYPAVKKMCDTSTTPITSIPHFIMYMNSSPVLMFKKPDGPISDKINEAFRKFQSTQNKATPSAAAAGYSNRMGYAMPSVPPPTSGYSGMGQAPLGGGRLWTPEIGAPPMSVGSGMRSISNQDDDSLLESGNVVPHNVPWRI